jgi:putative peptidoglycan lipid II flippase
MTAPDDRARWSNEPTVPLSAVGGDLASQPTVALPIVPPPASPASSALPAVQAPQPAPIVPPSPSSPPDVDDSTGSVARNSSAMAIGSLVSRATGFLRVAVIGAVAGGATVGDDYNLANNLPNMVYELLLGGVLASVLIPVLVRARKDDPDRGQAYAQRLLTLAVVAIGAATVVVVAAAPLLTALVTSKSTAPDDRQLVTTLAYLLLPEIFFYGLAGIFAAILNTRGHFAAPMWTPILNNIVVIITGGVFAVMRLGQAGPTPGNITLAEVVVLGLGTTLGIIVQAAGLWPALRRVGFRWQWRWDFRELHLRELARLGAWMLLYVGVNQVSITVVARIAKLVGQQGQPGVIVYNNAFLIFMMAHGIVAVSVITAIMPRMAAAAADGRSGDVAEQMSQGTRLATVILAPAAALYIALGQPLAITLFNWGRYTHDQAVATGWVITMAGLGLVPYAITMLQTSALYALRDTRSPALLNVPVAAVRIGIDVVFYLVLPASIVTASLMFGTAASFVVALVFGYWILRRKIGRLGLRRVADTLIRLTVAAGVAGLVAFGVAWLIAKGIGDGKVASIIELAVGGLVLVAVYAAVATGLRVQEVSQFAGMLRRRLGR